MTRIVITGGPRTGKTTLALSMGMDIYPCDVSHTDDLIEHLHWSQVSEHIALEWLPQPGPWIIEGVALARALRKWREAHPGEPPPVDRVIYLREPHESLTPGQRTMAKGVETVHREIEPWLEEHNIMTEYR